MGVAIVSFNSSENINKFLIQQNIKSSVDYVWSTSMIGGKEKTLKNSLNFLGANAQEVLYVGDEVRDEVACQKAGIPIAAVTWGFNSKDILS